jgi:hypothetical protein
MRETLHTGIGSLPHLNLDAAIEFALRFDIPFVPQLPALNPHERMIPQALSGFPGFELPNDPDSLKVIIHEQASSREGFNDALNRALDLRPQTQRLQPFEIYLPSHDHFRALRPFLWETSERGIDRVKVQMAGPWTCLNFLENQHGARGLKLPPETQSQILKWLLLRAVALIRLVNESGAEPWLFIDEPYLFQLSPEKEAAHRVFFQELKTFFATLRTEVLRYNGKLGLHCCSDANWKRILPDLSLDFLSVDARVSSHSLQSLPDEVLTGFTRQNGEFIWGIVPSNLSLGDEAPPQLGPTMPPDRQEWISPACGLAYHSPLECEEVISRLNAWKRKTSPR